jgi:hypothetical protein
MSDPRHNPGSGRPSHGRSKQRMRAPSRRTISRWPSCLSSWTHSEPEGSHGLMKRRQGHDRSLCLDARWPGGTGPLAAERCIAFLGSALRRLRCRCRRELMITLLARRWCLGARSVAHHVLCAAPDAALRVPCVVPVAVPRARFAGPVAARCQTSQYPWAASWAWSVW